MARQVIARYSDYDVKVIAPIADHTNTPLDDAAGASSSFKVYDPAMDESISVAEAAGQDVLNVTNVGVFRINKVVEVTQDDDSLHTQAITDIDTEAGTITIAAVTTDTCQPGNRVRVLLGSKISQAEFGTANIDTENWGYIGVFPDTHVAHDDPLAKTGFNVDVETTFVGGVGLNRRKVDCLTIVEDDCE